VLSIESIVALVDSIISLADAAAFRNKLRNKVRIAHLINE